MIDRILLPLDGSDVAEEVIPYGEELAKKLGAEVILFHTCVPEYRLACNMHRLYLEKTAELMQERLEKASPKGESPRVQAAFLRGDFARSICDYVAAKDIDLVIMAAYGFTSIRVRKTGSVADRIFRLLECPSLLIRTGDSERARDRERLISRILLPLDGSEHAEMALPIVQELASKLKAEVNLFTMVKKAYLSDGSDNKKANAAEQKRIQNYLQGIEKKLKQQGINASNGLTLGEKQAEAISEAVKKADADMVVMATRGRSPNHAWRPGSTAHKLLNTGNLPLLIVSKIEKR